MRYLSRLALLSLIGLVLVSTSYAQWTRTATRMFGVPLSFNGIGAQFEYRDGVCWVGSQFALYRSTDKGASWQRLGNIWDRITCLRFFDNKIGIMGHGTAGVDLTTDGGASWRTIANIGNVTALTFGATPSHILVTTGDAVIARTTDQGVNWAFETTSPKFLFQVQTVNGDTVIRQVGFDQIGTWLEFSTDFGLTWSSPLSGAAAHYDSWMPALDSCERSTMFIANEEALLQTDRRSDVFRSTNRGSTWTSVFSKPAAYLGGGIHTTFRAIYAGSINGIERSTDRGDTWQNIGGPRMLFDCLPFLSIDDSVIVAVDTGGNMWRTTNAGGAEIPPEIGTISASLDSIGFDTTAFCDDASFRTVFFAHACTRIADVRIEGDSAFTIIGSSGDSVAVMPRPHQAGHHDGTLVVFGTNGQTIRIPLTATTRDAQFSATPLSVDYDTVTYCELPPTFTIHLAHDCSTLDSVGISGDSAFAIALATSDSIVLRLQQNRAGAHDATLLVVSSGGKTITISLTAYTRAPQRIQAAVPILSIRNDTIGGTVRIPIVTGSTTEFPGGAFDISFDTAMLEFDGAHDSHGNALAVHERTRSATINFAQGVDTVFAEFRVFPRSTYACTAVSIDSFTSDVAGICYALALGRADVDICSDGGCGGALLSEFVRRHDILPLRIAPNPGDHYVTVTADFPILSLEVYSTSGDKLLELDAPSDNARTLDLTNLPHGTLYIVTHDDKGRIAFGTMLHE